MVWRGPYQCIFPLPNPADWAPFTIGEPFDVKKGRRLTKSDRLPGPVRFIGASEKRNGVTDYNDVEPTFGGGQLTVVYNGNSVGWTFYQEAPFFACDDVNVLEPTVPISMWALLFVATVLRHSKARYTYGYKWTKERMMQTEVRLPVTPESEPDWDTMGRYMQGLRFSAALAAYQTRG